MDLENYIEKRLNPSQFQAVKSLQGPLLILAGAGSGKTRVLTYRIANLIAQGEAAPGEILAVTFTNKAAREMAQRTYSILDELGIPVYHDLWISTFHSTCARILRDKIHLLEYQPFFVIYDDADQLSMIKKVMNQLDINDKVHPAKAFKSRINEAKMMGLSPDDLLKKRHFILDERSVDVYRVYEEEMKRANALDFGDLLLKTHELFQMYPDVLEEYQDKFRYIMVDEYQDTNHIQYLLVQMLAKKHRNLCVVGDEDQSIYSWRGADISNILDFENDFEECAVIKLEENYRSTKTIVKAANELIKNNTQRKSKVLFTNNHDGSLIHVKEEKTDYDEAKYVVRTIESLMNQNINYQYSDFAVFYRTNAQSRVLEDQLRSQSIPYKLVGGVKFYERMEIKDILAYMKLLINPNDDVSLKRIINTPARGIGKTTISKLEVVASEHKQSMLNAINYLCDHRLIHAGAVKKVRQFKILMENLSQNIENLKPTEIYLEILQATEYVLKLKGENTPEAQARIENLEEFNNAIAQFEKERGDEATLLSFLEEMALVSDVDTMEESDNSVTLMTLHISKGLEFPNVFIVGLEEGLFPTGRALDETDPDAMEEERRLAYVGMTRARENLYLTYARTRRVWGQEQQHPPSRFINEIPKEYVKFESSLGQPKSRFMSRYKSGSYQDSRAYESNGFTHQEYSSKTQSFDEVPSYEDFSDVPLQSSYRKGMKVRHTTFGAGTIYEVEGNGDTQKVSVLFTNSTLKKFVIKYARLEII
ncbi:MAG: UvrD-helicase domain-containing protein [Bdellovibrionales bacterium]|nr:UvrD-helicase domain-containing protein [Bdellovibrionales bacterium]